MVSPSWWRIYRLAPPVYTAQPPTQTPSASATAQTEQSPQTPHDAHKSTRHAQRPKPSANTHPAPSWGTPHKSSSRNACHAEPTRRTQHPPPTGESPHTPHPQTRSRRSLQTLHKLPTHPRTALLTRPTNRRPRRASRLSDPLHRPPLVHQPLNQRPKPFSRHMIIRVAECCVHALRVGGQPVLHLNRIDEAQHGRDESVVQAPFLEESPGAFFLFFGEVGEGVVVEPVWVDVFHGVP